MEILREPSCPSWRSIRLSFQFRGDKEFLRRVVVLDAQHIGLAADLAVFYVALSASGRLVDRGGVPFSAGGALESGFHPKEHTADYFVVNSPAFRYRRGGLRGKLLSLRVSD